MRLKEISNSVHTTQPNIFKRRNSKENRLAFQLFWLNFFTIFSIIFLMLITVNRWVPVLEKDYYYLRQLWRVCFNVCQSFIPIITIINNRSKLKIKKTIFYNQISIYF